MPTLEQRISEFFIGGAPELKDVSYMTYPLETPSGMDLQTTPLVKLGTPIETSGILRVRTVCAVHYSDT
jgi:hypothetical protein